MARSDSDLSVLVGVGAGFRIETLACGCQYDGSSANGLQQQHDHSCMTMHAASFVQRDGYLSHLSLLLGVCAGFRMVNETCEFPGHRC